MAEELKQPTEAELAAKRAAFDRVLAAALAERTDMISLYDCAIWLLYACTRSDAISQAKEMIENGDIEEDDEAHTIALEIEDAIDLVHDDVDSATAHETDIESIGKQLDPEFDLPAHTLTDWLDNR
jgi:hypothetical protein